MRMKGLVYLGLAGATAYLGYRQLKGYLSPLNPHRARAFGQYLVGRKRKVMAVGPNIVDIHRFAGGTLRLMAGSGSSVQIVVATDQETLTGKTRDLPAAVPLGLEPSQLRDADRLIEELRSLWRRINPDTIVCPDPTHPLPLRSMTCRNVGRAVLTLKEGLPENGTEVIFYGTRLPNAVVDVETVMDEKMVGVSGSAGDGTLGRLDITLWSKLGTQGTGFSYAEGFRFLALKEVVAEEIPTPGP